MQKKKFPRNTVRVQDLESLHADFYQKKRVQFCMQTNHSILKHKATTPHDCDVCKDC